MTKSITATLIFAVALLLTGCSQTSVFNAAETVPDCPYDIVQGPTQGVTERHISYATNITAEACGFSIAYFTDVLGMEADLLAGYDIYFLNQTLDDSSGCCFAENEGDRVKIFTDIDHEQWGQELRWLFTRGRAVYWHQIRNGIHEYVHAVQIKLGAVQTSRGNHMPSWFIEGMAEYIAFDAIIRKRALTRRQAYEFQLFSAIDSNEMTYPLSAYAPSNYPAWPGHVGMIVVAGLLEYADKGPESLIEYTRLAGQYRSHNRALQEVYGISAEEMYTQVEAWRQLVGNNPNAQPLWSR